MNDSQHSQYIKIAKQLARAVIASKITVDEYAENLMSQCCLLSSFDETTADVVAASVPDIARPRLVEEIERVLVPNYSLPKLHFGGSQPTELELERIRCMYLSRVRAFAVALAVAVRSSSK